MIKAQRAIPALRFGPRQGNFLETVRTLNSGNFRHGEGVHRDLCKNTVASRGGWGIDPCTVAPTRPVVSASHVAVEPTSLPSGL